MEGAGRMLTRDKRLIMRIGRPEYGGAFESEGGGPVPFALPGELVEESTRPADGLQVLEPSPRRVPAGCVHFGTCGGCHYQHADYEFQTDLKQQILVRLLGDAALGDLPPVQVLAGQPWGYRNRIRLRVRVEAGHAVEFGYSLARTNTFLPVKMCPIAAPLLWRVVEALRELADSDRRVRDWLGDSAELELFCDGAEQRLQMQIFLREAGTAAREPGGFSAVCEALRCVIPELAGAGAQLAPELSRRARRSWEGAGWGPAGLNYEVARRRYWVSRGAFFQVNRLLVDDLVRLVAREAGQGEVAWDLFAGVGLFTRSLAEGFKRVVAVEGAEHAAADLLRAGLGPGVHASYEAVRMAAEEFLRRQQTQRERPQVVVLDPPRAGLGVEGSALLARLAPARIVYVSCDPVTLARDLRVLVEAGYRVCAVHMVDLFPQTFHVEAVVRLERDVVGG